MTIQTSIFGGWTLTDEDAKAFLKQINDTKPNPLAQASYERGGELLDEYLKKGYATISPTK